MNRNEQAASMARGSRRDVSHSKTGIPCVVETFTPGPEEPFVSVLIAISHSEFIEEREVEDIEYELLEEVPVHYPSTAKYAITFPLEIGDEGWLTFSDRELMHWQFDPAFTTKQRRNRFKNLNDAVFIPGPWKRVKPIVEYSTEAMELRTIDNLAKISISETGTIEIKALELLIDCASIKIGGVEWETFNPKTSCLGLPIPVPKIPPEPVPKLRP